ncbi:NAD-dependent dehydratase [Cnuibacter physcomitrellae]|uniref:NAD-dependent dehydratase n=1 Tax=Cnuibacter physcomitrellae TaxID=1619308 RepID=A0A1X9LVV3_9MICO|nr:SDR family oxidoreductase [Cnuibacter physcomitrellae]ARJ06160.1 NAD-dependent dehydratase [Cnuibacter physcomitrellae]GGI37358.1 NAD-dependent dehydratase [Cnuibacter physcomitrellae]
MRIAIAGGHGKIALQTTKLLSASGHEVVGIVRNPDHAGDVEAAGGEALVFDLEASDSEALAHELSQREIDAVVFAAGAGPGSSADRKLTVDRDGAILLADAAWRADVKRYVLVSAMSADDYDPTSDDVFQVYLRAKSEADAAVRASELDWTIVRPGGLTDEPATGLVTLAASTGRGTIPRADVAWIVATLFTTDAAVRAQFEAISGSTPIAEALRDL